MRKPQRDGLDQELKMLSPAEGKESSGGDQGWRDVREARERSVDCWSLLH